MKVLVTGSAGHLGEALLRRLVTSEHDVVGLDLLPSPFTDAVGSVADADFVAEVMSKGFDAVLHAATLHKPHVASHPQQSFVDTNITGTLNLLQQSVATGVERFVFTSTTSAFGRALTPPSGRPAVWVTEDLVGAPKNIYGLTKVAAEGLCELAHNQHGLTCVVLRTSRFFPERDDSPEVGENYSLDNAQTNELLYRRLDLADAVQAHLLALHRAPELGFDRFILSATTPFTPDQAAQLATDARAVVAHLFPQYPGIYRRLGWQLFPTLDRVYDNSRARQVLGWEPEHGFGTALTAAATGSPVRSDLATAVGAKGYHDQPTGPYTTQARKVQQ